MNVHTHELCTEDHAGTSTAGLPDPEWLGKPHCSECGEVAPAEVQEFVDLVKAAVAQAEADAQAMIADAIAAVNVLPVTRRINEFLASMSIEDMDEVYGPELTGLFLEMNQALEPIE